jgi:hypothetical protein
MTIAGTVQEATLDCLVTPGLFSSEVGVLITLADGRQVSALVDKRQVVTLEELRRGEKTQGRVKVAVISEEKDSVIIDLPQPTLSNGPRLRVSKNALRFD